MRSPIRYLTRVSVWRMIVTGGCTGMVGEDESGGAVSAVTYESAACKVVYTITSQWSGGFGADIQVTNKPGAALNGSARRPGCRQAGGRRRTVELL